MAKNIIVSNRLPIRITKVENSFKFTPTSGGLATGVKSIHQDKNALWIGWPGIGVDEIEEDLLPSIDADLRAKNFLAVHLTQNELDNFYYGLPNKCLWPLFHYFIEYSVFNEGQWSSYIEANQKFADKVIEQIEPGDTVWIHDYQLLLCPKMIKDVCPDVQIGFFLHIPFPSFEIFRIFPWREKLLEGMLGADLIGFHTFDYQRHFLSSVKRIAKLDVRFNRILQNQREIVVNTFPMGIDFKKFQEAARNHNLQKEAEKSELKRQLELHKKASESGKLILSIDRLDYTKGVVNRINAFDLFLTKYPEYCEKVRLVMLTVPSRSDVPEYMRLKKETDELVGRINGKYATVNWTPIWYYYRAMDFDDLIDLYMTSDIAMITPVRDGMNLVAKEFVATRVEGDGVLILSEMAGASKELFEAVLVNPFDLNAMADSLLEAIRMPLNEQKRRNLSMQKRLKRYSVEHWAQEFMKSLQTTQLLQFEENTPKLSSKVQDEIIEAFHNAKNKAILLDYDGTLVEFHDNPDRAVPDKELLQNLKYLSEQAHTSISIISGRDQKFLNYHFKDLELTLAAEHGHFMKRNGGEWKGAAVKSKDWMQNIVPIFESFTDRTPGTFIEEKKNSLVWHYRKTDPELADQRVTELKTVLSSLISNRLSIMDMDKALEVVDQRTDKGTAVAEIIRQKNYDFILCIGDDVTDENMFAALPSHAISIKVGRKPTIASYYLENVSQVKALIQAMNCVKVEG